MAVFSQDICNSTKKSEVVAVVISPVNQKGGVGKSFSVFHLSGYFAAKGAKVLCIDNDSQYSISKAFFGEDEADSFAPSTTVAALYDQRVLEAPETLIRKTRFTNIDVVCGSFEAGNFNAPINLMPDELQLVLKHFVEQVRNQYHIVLIDNPPNLQLLTYASLAASTFAFCITEAEKMAVSEIKPVRIAFDQVLRTTNPSLRFSGYVINKFKTKRVGQQYFKEELQNKFGTKVFSTILPDWSDLSESITMSTPVSFYKPHSEAGKMFKALAEELIDRNEMHLQQPPEFQFDELS